MEFEQTPYQYLHCGAIMLNGMACPVVALMALQSAYKAAADRAHSSKDLVYNDVAWYDWMFLAGQVGDLIAFRDGNAPYPNPDPDPENRLIRYGICEPYKETE